VWRPIDDHSGEDIETFIQDGAAHRSYHPASSQQPISLTHWLAATIEAEIPNLPFDYFTMHGLCWALMLRLKDPFDTATGAAFTKQWSAQKHNLPFVVGFVFATAAGRQNITQLAVPTDRLLMLATETMERFLEEGNGEVVVGKERKL
jgi:hypothetical protein